MISLVLVRICTTGMGVPVVHGSSSGLTVSYGLFIAIAYNIKFLENKYSTVLFMNYEFGNNSFN